MNRYGKIGNRCGMAAALAFSLFGCMGSAAPAAEHGSETITFGYTERLFKHRNQTDVLAAIKVWAEAIGADAGLSIDSQMSVYRHPEEAVRALGENRIGAVTVGLQDYMLFPPDCLSGPFLTEVRDGTTHLRYVLIAAKGGGIADVGDLAGRRISVHDEPWTDIGLAWLESSLRAVGSGTLVETAAKVDLMPKANSAVLDVFFGRADACLVYEHLLESMADLNPQIGQRLTVVASSEPILVTILAFNSSMSASVKQKLLDVITSIHETPAGQQMTLMFQIDQMTAITAEELERSIELLSTWRAGGALQSERASR